jgi:hypothetical protein
LLFDCYSIINPASNSAALKINKTFNDLCFPEFLSQIPDIILKLL